MSLMNVGVTALTANQQALTTTGHNIANVNSAGYSRQTVATKALVGQNQGTGYVGKGVQVATIMRNYNELLGKQSNAANAASAADAIRYQSLMQMQDVYSGGNSSLGAAINDMMNAFADVEAAPADSTARNVVLTRISELTSRFRSASDTLKELDYSTKQNLANDVTLVNSLASQVATLNGQIARALASGHQPNDLLDARDQLIREINQYVQTSQVDADNGGISLFIGGSQPLVLGMDSATLSFDETKEYPGSQKQSLYIQQAGGQKIELSAAMVGGGEIAGLLKFNNDDLVTGQNLLGRLALAIGTTLNEQNKLGLTLSGNYGTDLFQLTSKTDGWSDIGNFTPGDATVEVTDASKLVASDYKVIFGDNNTAALIRLSDGKKTDIADTSNGVDITIDGLHFAIPTGVVNAAQKNQSVLFQPYSKAASEIQPLVHNANDLAVASAITANISNANKGTLQLSSLNATNTTDIPKFSKTPAVNERFNISFTVDSTTQAVTYSYTLQRYDSANDDWLDVSPSVTGNGNYVSGQVIKLPGAELNLTGTPQTGDQVALSHALSLGDGFKLNAGNANAFLGLRDAEIFDGGTTLSDGFSAAMAVIGTRTQSAQYAAELSATVASNLDADRTSVSGVNLDEEAARLLQYQQAYQASAKIIQTAQSLFDSVLNAVGR